MSTDVTSAVQPLAPSQVDHVVKSALPQGFHMSREAKVAVQKSATMFVLLMETLITSDKSQHLLGQLEQQLKRKRKDDRSTDDIAQVYGGRRILVSAADVRKALEDGGMAHIVPQLTATKRSR